MSAIFGVVGKEECTKDLYYGTDYQSPLGAKFGGLAILDGEGRVRQAIHSIKKNSFRAQLADFYGRFRGRRGIGVISDYEPQPLVIGSHLGDYAIVHVGAVKNIERLVEDAKKGGRHFSEMSNGKINPTELIAALINQGRTFCEGIEIMQKSIEGSSSVALLCNDGVIVARDKYGRTPVVIGKKKGATAVVSESCAFPNLGFEISRFLGSGEIGMINEEGYKQLRKPRAEMKLCTFLHVYYSNPASEVEGINVEIAIYNCGAMHAERDMAEGIDVDFVAGIPDSGTPHAIGYVNRSGKPYKRPYIKFTQTWQRSFMPQEQETRDLVAEMKLIPIPKLIKGNKILFCEDSIVRGTQLKEKIAELFRLGAEEVHTRPACPPLTSLCRYLNFSRSRDEFDLAARRAIRRIENGSENVDIRPYLDEGSEKYRQMVELIRTDLGLTSLRYQTREDMFKAIGLPAEKLCLGCWI